MKELLGVVLLGLAAGAATLTISPKSHDFGQVVVNGDLVKHFRLTMSAPANAIDTMRAIVVGPDAADFQVDFSPGNPMPGSPGSTCVNIWRPGACDWLVHFRPKSVGVKSAQLQVWIAPTIQSRVNPAALAIADLKGEGIFGCRPSVVHCNYADHYSGTFEMKSVDDAPSGAHVGHWETTVTVMVTKGVATCQVTRNDWEEDHSAGKRRSRSTATGTVTGPGFFAVEFEGRPGSLQYKLTAACPSPDLTTMFADYEAGTSGTGSEAGEPAKLGRDDLSTDLQAATKIGMDVLTGTQTDPHSNPGSNDGVSGSATLTWSLKR